VPADYPSPADQDTHYVHAATLHCSTQGQRLANKLLSPCNTKTSKLIKKYCVLTELWWVQVWLDDVVLALEHLAGGNF
jgi:hypothetical protein